MKILELYSDIVLSQEPVAIGRILLFRVIDAMIYTEC
jgi:hypothetical protein